MPGEELALAYFLANRATGQGRGKRGRAKNLPGVTEITRVPYCTPQINIFPKVKAGSSKTAGQNSKPCELHHIIKDM